MESITNFGYISLPEPLLPLVLSDKCSSHLGLKFFSVHIVCGLNLGFFFLALLLSLTLTARPLRFTTAARACAFFLLFNPLIGSPPLTEVGKAYLKREFDRIRQWIDGGYRRLMGTLAGDIAVDIGGRGRNAASVVTISGAGVVISTTSSRLISVHWQGRSRSVSTVTLVAYMN